MQLFAWLPPVTPRKDARHWRPDFGRAITRSLARGLYDIRSPMFTLFLD